MYYASYSPSRRILAVLITLGLLLAAALVGMQVRLSVRHLVMCIVGVACMLTIWAPAELFRRGALGLLLLTAGFGVRRLQLGANIWLHPSEVVVYCLVAAVLLRATLLGDRSVQLRLPLPAALFFTALPLGLLVALGADIPPARYLDRFKVMAAGMLLLLVLPGLLGNGRWPQRVGVGLALLSVALATLGLLEAVAPGLVAQLFGQETSESLFVIRTFRRVPFHFWGGPHATFIMLLALPWVLMLAEQARSAPGRLAGYGAAGLVIGVCLLGGYRGVWLGLACMLLGGALLGRRRATLLVGLVGLAPLLLQPRSFLDRLGGLGLGGDAADSSVANRIERMRYSWQLARDHPLLGAGWGGQGSAHSDVLQLAGDVGFVFATFFVLWIGWLLWRTLALARNPAHPELHATARSLALSFIGSLPLLAAEGLLYLPYIGLVFWLLVGCAHRLIEQAKQAYT